MRVLLIDDNPPDRVRYRRMLQRSSGDGFEIVEASDGRSGLAALEFATHPFDCVLLDQELPDLQGLDVLDDIRERPDAPPVVMLTGEEDAAISIEALRRGAADYLMKRRIDEDRLMRAIQGAIDRTQLAHRLREKEKHLARFYRLANQTEDALFIVDANTLEITDCNESARDRLKLLSNERVKDDASGRTLAGVDQWREFCERTRTEGSACYEWLVVRADGSRSIVEFRSRSIVEDDASYIVAVGRDVSLRKQRENDLVERSIRDGLTGIWNRRAFDERLALYAREAALERKPLAVIMIDIDHFKDYNDSLGHLAGDDCLRRVAHALRSGSLRGSSLLARYGGEEFVALVDHADLEVTRKVAERLRRTVMSLGLPHPKSGVAACVTVSAGGATMIPNADTDLQSLVATADAALYRAKQAGRNRVIVEPL